MKKILLLVLSHAFFILSFAQTQNYTKAKGLGFSFILNDFQTASDIRANGLVSVLKDKNLFNFQRFHPGMAVNYLSGLSKHVDFISSLEASLLDYPVKNQLSFNSNTLLLEATSSLNIKLLSDRYWLTPYFDIGVGASKYKKYFAAFAPVGVGLQVNILRQVFILINSQYRIPVTENASYHFTHSLSVVANLKEKVEPAKVVEVIPIPVVTDRDGDGIVDSLDACPDEKGLAAFDGCPDKDGDGIPDKDDKCPTIPGLAKYQGCPIPDTDRDGINDEEDKCPNTPGVVRYQGCPIPDTDGDGVNDEEDKCPNEKGPASNYGCPVIDVVVVEKVNKAAQNIFFATGSAKLLRKSFPSLKDVAQVMKDNPSYSIQVDGHTDNTGNDELNQKLSESRAGAVKKYLVDNGIDEARINSAGYGETKPIADNNTSAGRSKNRRVEMTLKNY
ncbi:MAG: OmpA family protein [Ginsengibacter sp.]